MEAEGPAAAVPGGGPGLQHPRQDDPGRAGDPASVSFTPSAPRPSQVSAPEPLAVSCSTQEVAGQQGGDGGDPSGLGPWKPPPFYWASWTSLCHFQMRDTEGQGRKSHRLSSILSSARHPRPGPGFCRPIPMVLTAVPQ